jgi:hypothetical protein
LHVRTLSQIAGAIELKAKITARLAQNSIISFTWTDRVRGLSNKLIKPGWK